MGIGGVDLEIDEAGVGDLAVDEDVAAVGPVAVGLVRNRVLRYPAAGDDLDTAVGDDRGPGDHFEVAISNPAEERSADLVLDLHQMLGGEQILVLGGHRRLDVDLGAEEVVATAAIGEQAHRGGVGIGLGGVGADDNLADADGLAEVDLHRQWHRVADVEDERRIDRAGGGGDADLRKVERLRLVGVVPGGQHGGLPGKRDRADPVLTGNAADRGERSAPVMELRASVEIGEPRKRRAGVELEFVGVGDVADVHRRAVGGICLVVEDLEVVHVRLVFVVRRIVGVRKANVLEGQQAPIFERLHCRDHILAAQPLPPGQPGRASLRAGGVEITGEAVENAAELHGAFS